MLPLQPCFRLPSEAEGSIPLQGDQIASLLAQLHTKCISYIRKQTFFFVKDIELQTLLIKLSECDNWNLNITMMKWETKKQEREVKFLENAFL